ncbi:MAG: hypothetical protein KJZ80_09620 [Hyphomicrobiaceae bacterium]|nr:hypothetical protein [Hyphomicrobiaceae bacterium]
MYLRSLAAGLVAALPLAGAPAATAADIFGPYDPALSESPYDDERYADIYRDAPRRLPPRYAEPPPAYPYAGPSHARPRFEEPYRYAEPGHPPPYRWPRDRRWRGEYLEPMHRAPGFQDHRIRRAHAPPGCTRRQEIRRELIRDGWSDLHDLDLGGEVAFATARRPNGQLYRLEIDRCGGDILRARRIENGDAYVWRRREHYPAY